MAKRRSRMLRRDREWYNAHPPICPSCGVLGRHYVPPSLGEPGFFWCAS